MTAPHSQLLRLQLRWNGYDPLPLIGKAPVLREWQKWIDRSENDILIWSKRFPNATNTGVLTRLVPTLDLDILDQDAVRTIEELVRARYGWVLMRTGRAPKCAIPFRTNEPFAKIIANLTAPAGAEHKIEFLGNGQQVVVDGIHPDTHQPYRWHGGSPADTKREDLPTIREAEARELVDCIVATLSAKHGYRRVVAEFPSSLSPRVSFGGDGSEARGDGSTLSVLPRSREASYAYCAMIAALNEVLNARPGERNSKLNVRAYSLGRLVARGWITAEQVVQGLELVCQYNLLTRDDGEGQVRATIASGLKAGMASPYPDDIFRKAKA